MLSGRLSSIFIKKRKRSFVIISTWSMNRVSPSWQSADSLFLSQAERSGRPAETGQAVRLQHVSSGWRRRGGAAPAEPGAPAGGHLGSGEQLFAFTSWKLWTSREGGSWDERSGPTGSTHGGRFGLSVWRTDTTRERKFKSGGVTSETGFLLTRFRSDEH